MDALLRAPRLARVANQLLRGSDARQRPNPVGTPVARVTIVDFSKSHSGITTKPSTL